MTKAVRIPVTVKMRAGWNDSERNAPTARQDGRGRRRGGGCGPRTHGRAELPGWSDWDLVARIAETLTHSGLRQRRLHRARARRRRVACPASTGVLVGRGVLRNPWILAQAADVAAGRPPREVTLADRGRFLLDYIELLRHERVHEPKGFRHVAPATEGAAAAGRRAQLHDRWVINKIRALGSWYTKGLENGSHLRTAINSAESLDALQEIIDSFFAVSSIPV